MGIIRRLQKRRHLSLLKFHYPALFDEDIQAVRLTALEPDIRGRSVAVVGNAQSLFERDDGNMIDAHDLVVRVNRGFIREPVKQGVRTDFHCLATLIPAEQIEREFPAAKVIYVTPERWPLWSSGLAMRREVLCLPLPHHESIAHRLGSRPSSGLISILLFRDLGAEAISLYGFDWKASKTFYAKRLRLDVHDWQRERNAVLQWRQEGWLNIPSLG